MTKEQFKKHLTEHGITKAMKQIKLQLGQWKKALCPHCNKIIKLIK